MPQYLHQKFTEDFNLSEYDAQVLTDSKEIALFFEQICNYTKNYKAASNWMMGPIKSYLNELTLHIDDFPLTPNQIADLISLVDNGKVNYNLASKQIFPHLLENPGKHPIEAAESLHLLQSTDENALQEIITAVVASNPAKVAEYKAGKQSLLGMFMGDVMKKTQGKADPKIANELLRKTLETA